MKRVRIVQGQNNVAASVYVRSMRAFLPFGLSLLLCALVPFGLSLAPRGLEIGQGQTVLSRYGPWSQEDLATIEAVWVQIQDFRSSAFARRARAEKVLSTTDVPTLVRSLSYKRMPDGPGVEPYTAAVRDLLSTRLPEIESMLTNKGPLRDKEMACQLLDTRWPQSESFVPALAQAMRDGSVQAELKLREFGSDAEAALPLLKDMLLDPNCSQDAAGVLFSIGTHSLPILSQGLYDADPTVNGRAVGPLVAIVAMGDPGLQSQYTLVLARIVGDPSLDEVRAYRYGGTPPRFLALEVLGHVAANNRQAVATLIAALKDPNTHICMNSAEELGYLGEAARTAVPSLVEALKDRRGDVRVAAANAVATLGHVARPWLPSIRKMIDGRHFDIDFTAAFTLSHFGPDGASAMPVLIAGLHTGDLRTHDVAIESILRLGEFAKPHLPAIRELLHNKDSSVRAAAVSVLSQFAQHGGQG